MIKSRKIVEKGMYVSAVILGVAAYMGALDMLHPPQRVKPGRKRVACVGDSITYGCFIAGQPWNSYPRQLGRLLGKEYCVGNFGYTNRTAINTGDFPYTSEKLYERSLEFMPDIVLIMLGTNDTKEINWDPEKYKKDMGKLINSYRSLGTHPEVYLLLPLPVFSLTGKVRWGIRSNVLEKELIPACRQVAEENNATIINTHDVFAGKKFMFIDGVHPNRLGARLLAETVYSEISEK